ncbi:deoxyribodipyrimidine photo-lyase [Modestobacter sp. VKM Ac-2979]|uniref:cryptochrome/photolyase family protein n=1 Tax=unclassified Modestobacter TaxID=2643866 RepID=UPI0022AB8757|nr:MULTISPECIES: deoxyribodipyrimidine photo-lyase [unclassified Modestobacter]MCZ2810540.1 deoxyribodipyrimidine photo-lyase [Modestobacter sp. VKM Ac-2979]MCZ2842026.1 deoxyribodipyrimidine photo-lyase [Modestobacter sp. VKM Ac-2980]
MPIALLWFRRDLRLDDHPALLAAADAAGPQGSVVPVFVFDDRLYGPSGEPRRRFLLDCLAELDTATGGALVTRTGDPAAVLPRLVAELGAVSVHVTADAGPYGRRRDQAVERALGDVPLVRTGSPYAVAPGRVVKRDGTPFQVFTPFARAWREHGWHSPAVRPDQVPWQRDVRSDDRPPRPALDDVQLPAAGEAAALEAWHRFRDERLLGYDEGRDRPATNGTSRLSAYLKYGCIHPRTLLADLAAEEGSESVRRYTDELAWRDFYADVLWHRPDSAREYLKPELQGMGYDSGPDAEELVRAWETGRTGFPIVDAGMRQLLGEAYVHNRVRMIVASFLVKDLHQEWTHGARYFMQHLVDGDLASNNHGWQWVAGTGTDASPYYRVFNPITQGKKFDPDGSYVKRWVPELRDLDPKHVHEPWTAPGGVPAGYPEPIVDHAHERQVSLDRYAALRAR